MITAERLSEPLECFDIYSGKANMPRHIIRLRCYHYGGENHGVLKEMGDYAWEDAFPGNE